MRGGNKLERGTEMVHGKEECWICCEVWWGTLEMEVRLEDKLLEVIYCRAEVGTGETVTEDSTESK